MLGIPVTRLYRICDFFDSDSEDAWDLIEGEFFEYEPGQAPGPTESPSQVGWCGHAGAGFVGTAPVRWPTPLPLLV